MATVTENVAATQPTNKDEKPKYSMAVKWQKADGEWIESTSDRTFDVPDPIGTIEVKVVDDSGKVAEKPVERKFERMLFRGPQDVLSGLESNPYLITAFCNYAADLFSRGTIKGPIAQEVEGPGKAIKKMAEQLFNSRKNLGKPITMDRALEIVAAMQSQD